MEQFFFDVPCGLYSAPMDFPGGSIEDEVQLTKSRRGVIYDIYDRLLTENPEYITKEILGDDSEKGLFRYRFADYETENLSQIPIKRFKVVIVPSIHGYEQGSAFVTANFFRLLCEEKNDPYLSFLKRNVVFEVLAVANPWGFDHNERKNENGVDLNRNFGAGFISGKDPSSSSYGGTEPFSEVETKIITKFIDDNSDAQIVLDYHNIAKGYPLFYVYSQKDVQLANSVFTSLSQKWIKEYSALPIGRIIGRIRPNGNAGMFADHLLQKEMWVLTMETPWCMPDIGKLQYDSTTLRISLDVFVNTLLFAIRSF